MIEVIGATGNIDDIDVFLQKMLVFSKQKKVILQIVNAEMIYGKDHLLSAAEHALRAFHQNKQSTNSLALEILLYASGERQIQKAIPKMGVKIGKQSVAFIIIGEQCAMDKKTMNTLIATVLHMNHFIRDDTVLAGTKETLKKFGIPDEEIRTVSEEKYQDLILEKVAMVDVIK